MFNIIILKYEQLGDVLRQHLVGTFNEVYELGISIGINIVTIRLDARTANRDPNPNHSVVSPDMRYLYDRCDYHFGIIINSLKTAFSTFYLYSFNHKVMKYH